MINKIIDKLELAKGDKEGHEFHGNQYRQIAHSLSAHFGEKRATVSNRLKNEDLRPTTYNASLETEAGHTYAEKTANEVKMGDATPHEAIKDMVIKYKEGRDGNQFKHTLSRNVDKFIDAYHGTPLHSQLKDTANQQGHRYDGDYEA